MSKYDSLTIREVPADELGRHEAGPGENWQESWGFLWNDPIKKAGGMNHISIWRNRGYADVWSWAAVNGRVVGKYQNLKLPMPDQDFPNWSAGGQTVTTHDGRRCRLQTVYDNASVDIEYEGHSDPVGFSYDLEGSSWGSNHYESIGRVSGRLTSGDETTEVSGFAWQDHSWGPRRWTDIMSHRWIVAEFGPDLFMSAIRIIPETNEEANYVGFIYDHGKLHKVRTATFGTQVADDGYSPVSCDAHIWTTDGHGYHVTGKVHTSSPHSHEEGMWFTDGLATFECGGRLGTGVFEIQELRGPARWHKELLP